MTKAVIKWPPEFDGIKIEKQSILGRVKDTDIWVEFDLCVTDWLDGIQPIELLETLLAWVEFSKSNS